MDFGVWGPDGDVGPGGVAVVRVSGELDIQTVPALEAVLMPAAGLGGQVIVDASALTFADSTGISLFVRAHRDAQAAAGRLDLVVTESAVRRVLDLSGLIGILNVHDTLDQARRSG